MLLSITHTEICFGIFSVLVLLVLFMSSNYLAIQSRSLLLDVMVIDSLLVFILGLPF